MCVFFTYVWNVGRINSYEKHSHFSNLILDCNLNVFYHIYPENLYKSVACHSYIDLPFTTEIKWCITRKTTFVALYSFRKNKTSHSLLNPVHRTGN